MWSHEEDKFYLLLFEHLWKNYLQHEGANYKKIEKWSQLRKGGDQQYKKVRELVDALRTLPEKKMNIADKETEMNKC